MAEQKSTLEEAGPNDQLIFTIVMIGEDGGEIGESFSPDFYPDRFNKAMEKELNRDGQQCKGEDISIKTFKNADIHANGVCKSSALSTLDKIHRHAGKVELYTPLSPNGGLEAYVKKVEFGELSGWNPKKDTWMFDYTLDLVSTGRDEYGGSQKNDIVSSYLSE